MLRPLRVRLKGARDVCTWPVTSPAVMQQYTLGVAIRDVLKAPEIQSDRGG
jgi:hypothetical protein